MTLKKKIGCAVSVVIAVIVVLLLLATCLSAASAAGIPATQQSNLNTNIDLGDLRYGMNTNDEGNGQYYLGLYLDTSCGVINSSQISIQRDPNDSLRGFVNAYISGTLDVTPTKVDWKSQSMDVTRRGGLSLSTYAGIGSYQEQMWDGKGLVLGDIFSESNLSASLSQIEGINYANASYREYDAHDWTWTEPDGTVYTQHEPARFWMNGTWNVQFANATSAKFASAFLPTSVSVSAVPEPSTFALLASGVAGLGVIVWRKRR